MYLLHVLPICHFPIFFVSPEFFPFYLNFLLSYLLFSPNITHHFYMYLCWCHIIPPPPPYHFPLPILLSHSSCSFFTPFLCYYILCHIIFPNWYFSLSYFTNDLTGQIIVDIALVYSFWCPSMSYSICPQLFSPYLIFSPLCYFSLYLLCCYVPLYFPLCYFPLIYVAMSHSFSPSVIFPFPMLLCPTLFPPHCYFPVYLCCYFPSFSPPLFSPYLCCFVPLYSRLCYFPLTYGDDSTGRIIVDITLVYSSRGVCRIQWVFRGSDQ